MCASRTGMRRGAIPLQQIVKTDVADEASCATVVAKTVEAFGGAFGLVNNASIFLTLKMRPFWEIPSDEWDRVQKVNLTGVFR